MATARNRKTPPKGTNPPAQHSFGRQRPSKATGGPTLHVAAPRDTHFRDLPQPTGKAPFELDLKSILPAASYADIVAKNKLTFHVNGDMGGINYDVPQMLVAKGMEQDFRDAAVPSDNPSFLYVLGDCVYFNGEVKEYYSQFYQPYEFYNAPIFAVPGNHDGENLDGDQSLDGFVRNFCAKSPVKMPESGDSNRTAMVQPNVYWTLLTPQVTFIGLYSNVPEGGQVKEPQISWLKDQLRKADANKPVFVCLHHPIYSADDHHSGSTHMKELIEQAAQATGRHPDMVLAGHVHNYQRLTKNLADNTQVPYLVVGGGGYHNLHHICTVADSHGDKQKMIAPVNFPDKGDDVVTLERYSDDHHGFLRMEISGDVITGKYFTVPRPQEPWSTGSQLIDYFEFDWRQKRYVPNHM
jgi:Icc-related predicted phosphoesterase